MTDSSEKSSYLSALRDRQLLHPIPADVMPAYEALRQEEFRRLATRAWPLLLLMYAGLNAFTYLLHSTHMNPRDLQLVMSSEAVSISIIVAGIILAHISWSRQRFNTWIPLCAAAILAIKIVAGLRFSQTALLMHQVHVTSMVVIVSTLALRLTTFAAGAACLLGMGAFAVALAFTESVHVFTFFAYYTLTCLVCLFVNALREDKDRISFLQAIQLEQKRAEVDRLNEELNILVRRDALTGLHNRRHFDEVLLREWERARRARESISVLLIDVDHFKAYNDTYGHPAGDDCLTRIARVFAGAMRRPGDTAARYGGEEFVILLPETDAAGATDVAHRILTDVDALNIPHEKSSTGHHVTVSIGIAVHIPLDATSSRDLLTEADIALYRAKQQGRHGIAVSAPAGLAGTVVVPLH